MSLCQIGQILLLYLCKFIKIFLSTKEKVKKVTFRALIHAQTALPPHIEAQSDTFLQSLFSTVFPQQETPTTKILLAKFSLTGLFNRNRKPL